MATLSDDEQELLEFLNFEDGSCQFNTWAISAGDLFTKGAQLQGLKRKGFVGAEGRAMNRQWWITDAGKAALAEAKVS